MKDRKRTELDGREVREEIGGVEEGKIIIRIYYVKKKSVFNKREKRWEDILMVITGDCEMA